MALRSLASLTLPSKLTAALAGVALIGGSAALAAPGDGVAADDTELEEPDGTTEEDGDAWALGRSDEDQLARFADFCDENPEASFCRGRSEGEPFEEVPIGRSGSEDDDELVSGADDDERSETARNVHRALTGSDDLSPGDEGFGEAVSNRARNGAPGALGSLVSRAAQGEKLDDEELEDIGERARPGPPEHANAGGDRDDDTGEDDDDASEQGARSSSQDAEGRSGPPSHANARGNR